MGLVLWVNPWVPQKALVKKILEAGQAFNTCGAHVSPRSRKVDRLLRKTRKGRNQEPTMSVMAQATA